MTTRQTLDHTGRPRGHVSSRGARPLVDQWTALRFEVLEAAREGRATYLPAGARDNSTARVLIDGKDVGQASTLMHYVCVAASAHTQFAEVPLHPKRDL